MCAVSAISNNRIKEIVKLHKKKYREETGLFIVEGFKSVQELIEANIETVEIYAIKNFGLGEKIIDETTMNKISTTTTACEILAVAKQKKSDLQTLKEANRLILLDSISDPGNLGTIIRSASAFGIEGIILYGDCVDLYSSKVIRSSAGNFFKTKIAHAKATEELKAIFPAHKIIATALSKDNNISINKCTNYEKYIVMFGTEATGLKKELLQIADKNIKLEMANNVESLNLSVCASIIMYELFSTKKINM